MRYSIGLVAVSIALLSGCQATKGNGEYFEFAKLNLVEKNLMIKPDSIAKSPVAKTVKSQPTPKSEKPVTKPKPIKVAKKPVAKSKSIKHANKTSVKPKRKPFDVQRSYYLYKGETYKNAMTRWFNRTGYDSVAWSISKHMKNKLNNVSKEKVTYTGSFPYVMNKLSWKLAEQDKKRFFISMDKQLKMGAVHEWQDRYVKIINVHGKTLRDTVKNLVIDYGWKWDDKQSWRTDKNFDGFSISFPIVSPKDDIGFALDQILKTRTVRAQYHDGTRTVFITDDI
jgi:hypothetical protein